MIRGGFRLWAVAAILLFSACKTYTEKIGDGLEYYRGGRMADAREEFRELLEDGGRDVHLYRLERGMTQIALGESNAAVQDFMAAINHLDSLVRESVTSDIGSLLIDDTVRPYLGAPFEQISARIFLSLAYMTMSGHFEDAAAACRDLDLKMEQIEACYNHSYQVDAEGEPANFSFQIPPLGKYLAALAAERRGYLDNAGIYMRQVLDSMPHSEFFKSEAERMKRGEKDHLVFVFALTDMVPHKIETVSKELTGLVKGIKVVYAIAKPESNPNAISRSVLTAPVRIPDYPRRAPVWHGGFSVRAAGGDQPVRTEMVADFDRYARKEFDTLRSGILIRAAVRRLIKETAGQVVGKQASKDKDTQKILGDLFASITSAMETVDTRSWCTLPREFHAARLSLGPDVASLNLQPLTPGGGRLGPEITVPLDLSDSRPAFVLVVHPGRRMQPIVLVDEDHRLRPAPRSGP